MLYKVILFVASSSDIVLISKIYIIFVEMLKLSCLKIRISKAMQKSELIRESIDE